MNARRPDTPMRIQSIRLARYCDVASRFLDELTGALWLTQRAQGGGCKSTRTIRLPQRGQCVGSNRANHLAEQLQQAAYHHSVSFMYLAAIVLTSLRTVVARLGSRTPSTSNRGVPRARTFLGKALGWHARPMFAQCPVCDCVWCDPL